VVGGEDYVAGSRSYFLIESSAAGGKSHAHQFVEWLLDEIKRDSASSR
jgi:hypothetical protein